MENLHKLITNLSGYELSSKEIEILKLGLGNGVATHPVESEMIVILEDIWDQTKNVQMIYQNSELRQQCMLLHVTILT